MPFRCRPHVKSLCWIVRVVYGYRVKYDASFSTVRVLWVCCVCDLAYLHWDRQNFEISLSFRHELGKSLMKSSEIWVYECMFNPLRAGAQIIGATVQRPSFGPADSGPGYYLDSSGGTSELSEMRARDEFEAALRASEAGL